MNKTRFVRLIAILLVTIALVGSVLFVFGMPPISVGWEFPTTQNVLPTVTRRPGCAPLPERSSDLGTPTATSYGRSALIAPSRVQITATPTHYAHIIDLDPEMDSYLKIHAIVYRCNGEWDLYWLDPQRDIDQAVNLQPGDILIADPPASIVGAHPPEPTVVRTPYPISSKH